MENPQESKLWQPPVPPLEKVAQETMLEKITNRVKNMQKDSTFFSTLTEEKLGQLLGDENLVAQDGEQKYYLLPDQSALQKLMDMIPAVASGEMSQNRRWHKTNVEISDEDQPWSHVMEVLQNIDKRLEQIELLLHKKE
ncbi:hypothetical protein [Pelosinus propionicus]|uniref:Uncharacterized protein n=1 Tax=Pelosinus propionicus DSM 13327 TaxID=1123291 RepID=A0A1I4JRN3_9FIRM|nr:hypothetical protein [Pelosinus propionicus]SFL68981.1 hypothetical protein SAMN04490355_1013105 [Pelosinus propionicus DSM 13327]